MHAIIIQARSPCCVHSHNQGTTMSISSFEAVATAFQSVEFSVEAANSADLAYNTTTGNPGDHKPFTVEDNPQMVAMNLVGVYAADSAAHMLAADEHGHVSETTYLHYLKAIAEGCLTPREFTIADLAANLAWRAGQPFRDMATKPLSRITRQVNCPWGMLSTEEKPKDRIQIKLGAQTLLTKINKK